MPTEQEYREAEIKWLWEARARLRRVYADEPAESIYPGTDEEWSASELMEQDEAMCARQDVKDHQPDDDEPITEEWLREIGFGGERNSGEYTFRFGRNDLAWYEYDDGDPELWIAGTQLPHIQTRGQLGRLLSALGIK